MYNESLSENINIYLKEMSEEITITDLPNELIIEILKRIDRNSLENAVLTCKLWKQLIESSCSWPLVLFYDNRVGYEEPWVDFMLNTNRRFHQIKIDDMVEVGSSRTLEIFRKHGSSVVKLFIYQSCLDKFDLFAELLRCMPNLEHVILFQTNTLCGMSDVPTDVDLPELKKMKTLEVIESEYSIIMCFTRAKLETLKILSSMHENPPETSEPVTDFLKTQHQLTTLVLRSIDHESNIFRTEIHNGAALFRLSKLSLLDIKLRESPNDYNNLVKFMKLQGKTLKELELGRKFSNSIYKFVFTNLKNLKSIRLLVNELPTDMAFYERLEENRSITNLVLMDSPPLNDLNTSCLPSFQKFLKLFPNVEQLTLLDYCEKESVQFIAGNLNKLKKLDVKYFNGSGFAGVHFPQLTLLSIGNVHEDIDWDRFTEDNYKITELIIENASFLKSSDVEKIVKNLKLHTLKIDMNFYADEELFDVIRKDCSTLKILDLHKSCVEDEFNLGEVPGLRLYANDFIRCCNALEFWNDKDYDGSRLPVDSGNENLDLTAMHPIDHYLMLINHFNEQGYEVFHDI